MVFIVNIVMLAIGATKTMNIDVFNYSHYALTGSVVYLISGKVTYGMIAAIFHAIFSLLSADFTAKRVQNEIGVKGISIPQGYASSTVPLYTILDKIYDKIPFMKNVKIDSKSNIKENWIDRRSMYNRNILRYSFRFIGGL